MRPLILLASVMLTLYASAPPSPAEEAAETRLQSPASQPAEESAQDR